jgi:hypothetical protein
MSGASSSPTGSASRTSRRQRVKILIVGTAEECEEAADRIARVLNARPVGRVTLRDDGKHQVRIDARLREDKPGT